MINRFWLGGFALVLAPLAHAGEPIVPASGILPHASLGAVGSPRVSPFGTYGYHATQWRPFPVAGTSIAKAPEPIPPSADPMAERPTLRQPAASLPSQIAPVPQPTSISARGKSGGFATQRVEPAEQTMVTVATPAKPILTAVSNDTIRASRHDDGVMRADWPVIPPLKK